MTSQQLFKYPVVPRPPGHEIRVSSIYPAGLLVGHCRKSLQRPENVWLPMLCFASHRSPEFYRPCRNKRPLSLRVWRWLNYRSVQVSSGFISPHCSLTRCCQRRLCHRPRRHCALGRRLQCGRWLYPNHAKLCKTLVKATVVYWILLVACGLFFFCCFCDILWAVTVLLHVKSCSSFVSMRRETLQDVSTRMPRGGLQLWTERWPQLSSQRTRSKTCTVQRLNWFLDGVQMHWGWFSNWCYSSGECASYWFN